MHARGSSTKAIKPSTLCHQSALSSKIIPNLTPSVATIKQTRLHSKDEVSFPASITDMYYAASTARSKLETEAGMDNLNLSRLVGHANLLDRVRDEIEAAEELHEARYQARLVQQYSLPGPKKASIVWADEQTTLSALHHDDSSSDEDEYYSDSESGSEGEQEILELIRTPTRCDTRKATIVKREGSPMPRKDLSTGRSIKVIPMPSMLPGIDEESDGEDVKNVGSLLRSFNRQIAVV